MHSTPSSSIEDAAYIRSIGTRIAPVFMSLTSAWHLSSRTMKPVGGFIRSALIFSAISCLPHSTDEPVFQQRPYAFDAIFPIDLLTLLQCPGLVGYRDLFYRNPPLEDLGGHFRTEFKTHASEIETLEKIGPEDLVAGGFISDPREEQHISQHSHHSAAEIERKVCSF